VGGGDARGEGGEGRGRRRGKRKLEGREGGDGREGEEEEEERGRGEEGRLTAKSSDDEDSEKEDCSLFGLAVATDNQRFCCTVEGGPRVFICGTGTQSHIHTQQNVYVCLQLYTQMELLVLFNKKQHQTVLNMYIHSSHCSGTKWHMHNQVPHPIV